MRGLEPLIGFIIFSLIIIAGVCINRKIKGTGEIK